MSYNEICIPAGEGNNFASIYIRNTFFFHSDIIGVVLAPPVTDWILFSAPHQTNEIPAYDKKSYGFLTAWPYTWHCWMPTDFQSSVPQGHLVLLNVQTEKLGIAFPLSPPPQKVPAASVVVVGIQWTYHYSHWQLLAACQATRYLLKYVYGKWCTSHTF